MLLSVQTLPEDRLDELDMNVAMKPEKLYFEIII